jgi:hypothetical protein
MKRDELIQLVKDYEYIFATEQGKRVLKDLSNQCYEHCVTFVPGSADGTAFNEGKRWVALHIRRMLETDPHQIGKDSHD